MRLFSSLILGISLSISPLAQAAEQKLATVEVTVNDDAAKSAAGIRTLYVIAYDSDSPMAMPFGALKVDLKADAKGTVYKGDLKVDLAAPKTPPGFMAVMGRSSALPKNLRLKARLDKDGGAGRDQPGDSVGTVDKITVGSSAKIVIDQVQK